MTVITEIGQLSITVDNEEYIFIPSFLNMSKLGTGEEIVDIFSTVYGGNIKEHEQQKSERDIISCAEDVLSACCDKDCSVITGYYAGNDKIEWVNGKIPTYDLVVIAQHLLKHGLVGDSPPKQEKSEGEYSREFRVRKFVYMAVAHLGISEHEAWNMTMTAFQEAIEAKYPKSPEKQIVSKEEYDEAMAWADKAVGLK